MKKIICVLFVLVMCMAPASVCFADDAVRLVDEADILTAEEETTLLSKLDEISERQKIDVAVVIIGTTGDKTIEAYADDYYDDNGYGFGDEHDGILLLVATEDGENGRVHISTCGYGITALTDSNIDAILDTFAVSYKDKDYAKAFADFAGDCDSYITAAREEEGFDVGFSLVISLAIGLILAFIITGGMKGQLKSVRSKLEASDYTKQGSLCINESRDFFLYSTVSRTEKKQDDDSDSSTHTSSSGRTHGGGGRDL